MVRKWGNRKQSVENVTRNYCAVVYGIFSNKCKPSTHHYNMQLEDLLHFTKFSASRFTANGSSSASESRGRGGAWRALRNSRRSRPETTSAAS